MMNLQFSKMQYGLFVGGVLLMVVLLWPARTPIPEGMTRETALAEASACIVAADTAMIYYDNCTVLQDIDPDRVADAQPKCGAEFELLRAFSSDRDAGEIDREAALTGALRDVQTTRADLQAQVSQIQQSTQTEAAAGDVWCAMYDAALTGSSDLDEVLRLIAARLLEQ